MKIRKLIFSAKLEQIEKQNQNIFIFHCSPNAAQWRFLKNFLFFSGRIAKDSNEYTNPAESSGFSAFPMHKQRQPEGRYDGASELMHYRALEDHPLESKVRDKVLVAIPIQKSSERGEINSRPLGRLDSPVNRLRGYTFFQSTSFKKRLAQHPLDKKNAACPMEDYSAPKKRTGAIISRKRLPFLGGPTGTNRLLAPQASQASKSSKKNLDQKDACSFSISARILFLKLIKKAWRPLN